MRIDEKLLRRLDLSISARDVTTSPMDRLPLLAVDKCLAGAEPALAKHVASFARSELLIESETLTMPRSSAGLRPINVLSPMSRTLYTALVNELSSSLPPSSRDFAGWNTHSAFGMPGSDVVKPYVVDTDITSCYEYVEHALLREELILQAMDVPAVDAVSTLLLDLFGKDRGLPQLIAASDLLADTYLLPIERSLMRQGYVVSRYADDFRILASDWSEANDVIEHTAEVARRFGLVLSSAKTLVRKSETLVDREKEKVAFLQRYIEEAKDELSFWSILFEGDYGEPVETLEEPDETTAEFEGLMRMVSDWVASPIDAGSSRTRYIKNALSVLRTGPDRVPDSWILQMVFREPLILENVVSYVLVRNETAKNWTTLAALVGMQRQSPWAKLWLLHTAETLPAYDGEDSVAVARWADAQLNDRHEAVRAQAAWYCAEIGTLSAPRLASLYTAATDISAASLAASLARAGIAKTSPIARAICGDSPLNAAAFDVASAAH